MNYWLYIIKRTNEGGIHVMVIVAVVYRVSTWSKVYWKFNEWNNHQIFNVTYSSNNIVMYMSHSCTWSYNSQTSRSISNYNNQKICTHKDTHTHTYIASYSMICYRLWWTITTCIDATNSIIISLRGTVYRTINMISYITIQVSWFVYIIYMCVCVLLDSN